MGQVTKKLRRATDAYFWYCPGCNEMHPLPDSWTFNGNLESPTFSPSFLHTWKYAGQDRRCHYVVTDGKVAYCSDSDHILAGQTIDMPDLPSEYCDP